MSKSSQQAREGERSSQGGWDKRGARCNVLTLRSREGRVCLSNLEDVAAPQAPGQADGELNFIQIVPIKALQGIG